MHTPQSEQAGVQAMSVSVRCRMHDSEPQGRKLAVCPRIQVDTLYDNPA